MLAEHGIEFERRDYFKERFTLDELRGLLDEINLRPSDLLSRRGKAYRDLNLDKQELSEDELIELIPDNPTLIRRPIVVKDGNVVIGFDKEKIEALIA